MVYRLFWVLITLFLAVGQAHADDKVTVLLDWFVNPNHAALLSAQYIGAYKEQNLDVEFVAPADPNTPPRLVAAKQADLALTYQPELYLLVDQGLPVVRVGTLIDTPLNTITVLADGPIKSLADFKGRRIGFAVAGVEDTIATEMVKSAGLKPEDVTMTNVNMQLVSALLSHVVDGIIGADRNFEYFELKEKGADPREFFPEENGVPLYDELILVANTTKLDDPKLKRFLVALEKGTSYLINHPDEMWQRFIKDHPDLDNSLNKSAWYATLPRFAKKPGVLDRQGYEEFAAFMQKQGLIKEKKPIASYAVELAP